MSETNDELVTKEEKFINDNINKILDDINNKINLGVIQSSPISVYLVKITRELGAPIENIGLECVGYPDQSTLNSGIDRYNEAVKSAKLVIPKPKKNSRIFMVQNGKHIMIVQTTVSTTPSGGC